MVAQPPGCCHHDMRAPLQRAPADLAAALDAWLAEAPGSAEPRDRAAGEAEQLRSLGYVE